MPAFSPGTAALIVEEITTTAALNALEPQWMRLWSRTPHATPFQSPQWLLPWWRHIGRGRLMTLAVRCLADGELVALLPLYVFTDSTSGRRHLFPIGIATTDYLDLLAKPGSEQRAIVAIVAHLADRSDAWDVLEFPQLRPMSPLLTRPLSKLWPQQVDEGEPNPLLVLRATAAGPLDPKIPRAMLDNLRYYRRRAVRAGTVSYHMADAQTIPDFLDALIRLHTRRWSDRGLAGVLNDQAALEAHREAAPRLHEAGLLRLLALHLDGCPIAVFYGLADSTPGRDPRWYYYLGGFDPRFAALSPGALLIAHAIERAGAEGAATFDFLRGREAYKYHWGAVDQPMYTLRLRQDGPPNYQSRD